MPAFFERLDKLAEIDATGAARWLDRAAFVLLMLMIAAAPHSIAATQIAWLTGMFLWLVSIGLQWSGSRRGNVDSGKGSGKAFKALHILLWAFFLWSAVTCWTSYAPDISLDKLRGAAVFLIFYFVFGVLRSFRAVRFASCLLIVSCMVNVIWTPVQRLIGRGVEIHGLAAGGPLSKALLTERDTLLEVNGEKVRTPDETVAAIEHSSGPAKVKFYRPDFEYSVEVSRTSLLPGEDPLSRLGIQGWSKSHNWRSSGFYGHYTTYAEVLQLVMALTFGLLIAGLLGGRPLGTLTAVFNSRFLGLSPAGILLFAALALMCLALLLTVTRASQLGFLVAAFVVVAFAGKRKLMFGLAAVALPLVIGGLIFLQQSRNVGFLDAKDDSTVYRETMWRDGMRIWTDSPHNFVFGVGMDSIQRYWREWGMFDGGKMPIGHFHSTPIQLLVERGLPALVLWLMLLAVYAFVIRMALKRTDPELPDESGKDPVSRGILLGCLGGIAGFFTSGLVHYNLGDQEVAMMFFLLMGLGLRTALLSAGKTAKDR